MPSQISPLASLNKYFLKYKWRFLGGVLFVAISNVFGIIPAKLIRYAMDAADTQIDWYRLTNGFELHKLVASAISFNLLVFGLLVLAMALLKGFFMFLMRQTIIVASRHVEYDMKNEIYDHYQKLDYAFYSKNSTGDLMNRISEDVGRVRSYVGPAVMYTVNLAVTMVLVISAMIQVNPTLTLLTLVPLPILSLVIYRVERIINRKSERVQAGLSDMSTFVQESFSGIRVLKSYASERHLERDFKSLADRYRAVSMDLVRTNALFHPSLVVLIGMSTIITVAVGGYMVTLGQITLGNIAEFVIYVNLLTWPVAALGWVVSLVQRAAASQKRINEFLDTKPDINPDMGQPFQLKGGMEFKNVSFKYPNTDIPVLQNISFVVEPGKSLAITGGTGSGKSTLALLMMRFCDPSSGSVLMDGVDLKNVSLQAFRRQTGFVPQEVFLFSESVSDNISFGLTDLPTNANLEQLVLEAAEAACVAHDIKSFPEGYATMVGERGITLSGGQKQRISLARALIRSPKLLILDDCLSAVDTLTEEKILSSLDRNTNGRTTIYISHRISTVMAADTILVLDQGRIVEHDSHVEWMKNQGFYFEMFEKQRLEASSGS
ncbi:MAG: ABC transporter ATP-binding protein [Bacteroidia bacterium]